MLEKGRQVFQAARRERELHSQIPCIKPAAVVLMSIHADSMPYPPLDLLAIESYQRRYPYVKLL